MISIFKNENGSTTLTILIAFAVVAALLSATLQWYWVNSSSEDVQIMADLGAMAEQEAIGRSVLIMQIIDVTILSANLLGLFIHGVVIVAGIATAAQAPLGGGVGTGFLSKAIEIDRKYVDRRKRFVDGLFAAAEKLNAVTPYLAFGYANTLVSENSDVRKRFSGTSYGVIPLPFPAQGKVMRANSANNSNELLNKVEQTSEENKNASTKILELEKVVEQQRRECFDNDIYKNNSAVFGTWEVSEALRDYSKEFKNRKESADSTVNSLLPIEESSLSAQSRVAGAYQRDRITLSQRIADAFTGAQGPADEPLQPQEMGTVNSFVPKASSSAYLLNHSDGERKAYHASSSCTGLANASDMPQVINVFSIIGQQDHPPCSICLPWHWEVTQTYQKQMDSLFVSWNKEVRAIIAYEKAKRDLEQQQKQLQDTTQSAFDELLASAKETIASDRLSYQPPGGRGVACIAFAQGKRKAPSFTLAKLTKTENNELGVPVAISASRLKPVESSNQVSDAINKTKTYYSPRNLRYGSVVFGFLEGDDSSYALLASLWNGVTNFFVSGSSGLDSIFDNLPWGIGAISHNFINKLEALAGMQKPDMRQYKPFLVNTSNIGSAEAGGVEGAFVNQISQGKKGLNKQAQIAQSSLAVLAKQALDQLPNDSFQSINPLMHYTVGNQSFVAPFWQGMSSRSVEKIQWAKTKGLALLGGQ